MTFIAAATKTAELVIISYKGCSFQPQSCLEGAAMVTALNSTDRDPGPSHVSPACTFPVLICCVLRSCVILLYCPVRRRFFFLVANVLSSNDLSVLHQQNNVQLGELIKQRPPSEHWFGPALCPAQQLAERNGPSASHHGPVLPFLGVSPPPDSPWIPGTPAWNAPPDSAALCPPPLPCGWF